MNQFFIERVQIDCLHIYRWVLGDIILIRGGPLHRWVEWVGTEKTHCKPFDLVKTEQWVFGYTLCVYPNRLDYTQFTVMPYWSNLRGRISSK